MNANNIFQLCVDFLRWLANIFGCTYQEINIIIFVILEPIIFLFMCWLIYKQRQAIRKLKAQ